MTHLHRSLVRMALLVAAAGCGSNDGTPPDDTGTGGDGGGGAGTTPDGGGPATTPDGGGPATTPDGGGSGGTCKTPDGFNFGQPITAPDKTWTFVDFPDAKCMNNTATGIGVNLNPNSDKVVIYLQGGGACFNTLTCLTVANAGGYGASNFSTDAASLPKYSLFNRDDATNPTKDWNYVYVPYCTGDVHSGNNPNGPSNRAHVRTVP